MYKQGKLLIIVLLIYSCGMTKTDSNVNLQMYGLHSLTLFIPNKTDFTNKRFGSDCNVCYPYNQHFINIFSTNNDTLGQIKITYSTPIADSTTVSNFSVNGIKSMCETYNGNYGIIGAWKQQPVKYFQCRRINAFESIILQHSIQHVELYQLYENQCIYFEFNNFKDSVYLYSIIESISYMSN